MQWGLACIPHALLPWLQVSIKGKTPPLHFLFPHRILYATREEALEIEAKELPQFDGIYPPHLCVLYTPVLRLCLQVVY